MIQSIKIYNNYKLICWFFYGTIILITSCGTKYPVEIVKVDSLRISLNNAIVKFATIDTVKINKVKQEINADLLFIQKNCTDTIAFATAELLEKYYAVIKTFELVQNKYPELNEEVRYTGIQLENFKHDLEYNIIKKENVKLFYEREDSAVKKNIASINAMINAIEFKIKLFDEISPKIKLIVANQANKQNTNPN